MSDHRYYISIMTPAASSGDITFQIDSLDAKTNVTITATVTGVTQGMTESQVAVLVMTQLACALPAYCGRPSFSAEPYQATWKATRSDFSVCLWSQAQFTVDLVSETTGCNPTLGGSPCLLTYAKFLKISSSFDGLNQITTPAGVVLSLAESIELISIASAELIQYLNNPVIISTYLGEFSTNGMKALFTSPCPGLHMDQPIVRRKNLYEMYSIPQYSRLAYDWIRHSGKLVFRFNQLYINAGKPFELDNEVRLTFTAGHTYVPSPIERCVVQLAKLALAQYSQGGFGNLTQLGGGSFKVVFGKFSDYLAGIFLAVRGYKQKKMN